MTDLEPAVLPYRPAGLFHRVAALCYDSLLVLAIVFLAVLLIIYPTGGAVEQKWFGVIPFAIGFLFFGGFWTQRGQTLGMRTWRLWLLTAHGQRIGWLRAGLRYLLAMASWGALLIGAGWSYLHAPAWWQMLLALLPGGLPIAWAMFDPDKSTVYDRLSGTRLVRVTTQSMLKP